MKLPHRLTRIKALLYDRRVRIPLQISISITLMSIFVGIAGNTNLLDSLRRISPVALLISTILFIASIVFGVLRWSLLLNALRIREPFLRLTESYLIGVFISLFLPGGTGGDVFRAYDVGRRHNAITKAALATLQERLISLGIFLIIGLGASVTYMHQLPRSLIFSALIFQLGGIFICFFVLFPQTALTFCRRVWSKLQHFKWFYHLFEWQVFQKLRSGLQMIMYVEPLRYSTLLKILVTTIISSLFVIGSYSITGWEIGITIVFQVFCVVIPMIFIVRMLPISFGGIGVGEGILVGLLQLFNVSSDKGLALGLIMLAIQTMCALIGGLLLLIRMLRGTWTKIREVG